MLQVLVLLNIAAFFILGWLRKPAILPGNDWSYFLVAFFCIWRVSRGGRISRVFLITSGGLSYAAAVLSLARVWNPAIAALIIIYAAQAVLLVSPPVFGHTRPTPVQVRAAGWAQIVRRPPSWLLPCGLFLGVVVTVAYLANMHPVTLPGCTPPSSDACSVMGQGYPLRWLTGSPYGDSVIDKYALIRDGVQWALTCTSVLYLGWLWLTAPTGVRPAQSGRP
jgi:hypothetical protein